MILREEQEALFWFGSGFLCWSWNLVQGWFFPVDKEAENLLAQEENKQGAGRGIIFSPSLIEQNGNGLLAFPNVNDNNCTDRFVIASIDFLPQHKLFLKMPLRGFLFAGRAGISGCSQLGLQDLPGLKSERESAKKGKSGGKIKNKKIKKRRRMRRMN